MAAKNKNKIKRKRLKARQGGGSHKHIANDFQGEKCYTKRSEVDMEKSIFEMLREVSVEESLDEFIARAEKTNLYFGEFLRDLAVIKDVSIESLSASSGVSEEIISKIERGTLEDCPSYTVLEKLADSISGSDRLKVKPVLQRLFSNQFDKYSPIPFPQEPYMFARNRSKGSLSEHEVSTLIRTLKAAW